MGLVVIIAAFRRRRPVFKGVCGREVVLAALACTTVAVSGSLPLLVSHSCRSFYLVPSFPFFSMAAGLIVAGTWRPRLRVRCTESARRGRTARVVAVVTLLLIVCWSVAQTGTARRDRTLFEQLKTLEQVLPEGTIVGASRECSHNWMAHALLYRYLRVSIDMGGSSTSRAFFLALKGGPLPNGFSPTRAGFSDAVLLQRVRVSPSSQESKR